MLWANYQKHKGEYMRKYLILLLTLGIIGLQSCDSDDTIVGGGFDPEPELTGCEATQFYD